MHFFTVHDNQSARITELPLEESSTNRAETVNVNKSDSRGQISSDDERVKASELDDDLELSQSLVTLDDSSTDNE